MLPDLDVADVTGIVMQTRTDNVKTISVRLVDGTGQTQSFIYWDLSPAGSVTRRPDHVTAGITGPLFTYKHSAASPPGSGPGGFFVGQCIAGGAFYPTTGNFPTAYRGSYFFADYVQGFIGRVDLANGNATYAFSNGLSQPVDLLVGSDGALYVLRRSAITRITSP